MRLIDADKLKIGLSEKTKTDSEESRFIDIIDGQKTAYDIGRVIEKIKDEIAETPEHRHKFCATVTNERCVQYQNCEDCMAERMIEIVESGGNGENRPKVRA